MTYARSRLWLGISGVGSVVVICCLSLWFGAPAAWFSQQPASWHVEAMQLFILMAGVAVWMVPFDFLGGFWLPRQHKRSNVTLTSWLRQYLVVAGVQISLFVLFGCLVLNAGREFGGIGAAIAVLTAVGSTVLVRNYFLLVRRDGRRGASGKLAGAVAMAEDWGISVPSIVAVTHSDEGFTGGIVGWGRWTKIVVPQSWLRFSTEQLAVMLARRSLAVQTGSYQRGATLALIWNLVGFFGAAWLFGAGLTTVSGIVTTACWFTLWTFLGLLTLPTLSRNASLAVDRELRQRGAPSDWILSTTYTMDQLQDGEPTRPAIVETIFHPIPSVSRRSPSESRVAMGAWNVARTTLFFSWGCLGFLARAVHCNVGRPELWMMLPSD